MGTALFQDALTLFTDAVNDISYESSIQSIPMECTSEGKSPDGGRINLRMKSVSQFLESVNFICFFINTILLNIATISS